MRVKIQGKRSPEDVTQTLLKFLENMLKNHPGISVSGVNCYLRFTNTEGENVQLCDKHGEPVELIVIEDGNKPKKSSKKQQATY